MSDKYNKEEQSVIQKIQNQTGCLLLVIGIAMLAFVLTDLIGSRNSIFGGNANSVGSIDGEPVDAQEYNELYETLIQNLQAQNPGLELNEQFRASYKQQAWNIIVQQKLVTQEYEKIGLSVGGAEMEDISIGPNTHTQIKNAFANPETGQFDKNRFIRFIQEDIVTNPEQKEQWVTFEHELRTQMIADKYSKILQKTFYATSLEARELVTNNEQNVNASLIGLSYSSIPDSLIQVSDKEITAYVRKHRKRYEQKASRDIEFIAFDVDPSKEDTLATVEWIADNMEDFKTTKLDSVFIENRGSETPYDPSFKVRGNFTPDVEDDLFRADTFEVLGPYENNGVYAAFKILEIGKDSLRSVRASHILMNPSGRTKQDTLATEVEARKLLADIRSGKTTFEQEATNRNFDGSGAQKGDLGWLREETNKVPKKFLDRALSAGKDNYFIVTTENGVHIGKATSRVSNRMVRVARLTQTVEAGTETDKIAYRNAGQFLAKAKGDKPFEEVANELGYSKNVSKKITEVERRVDGIKNGNIIARWLFNSDTEEGSVSDIIEVDGKYVVAHCTKVREEGLPSADDVRDQVELLVRNEKKAEQLRKRFDEALANANSADELAKALETVVTPVPAANFVEENVPYIGRDLKVIGALFGTTPGKHSEVVEGENGVYVVYVNSLSQFDMPADIRAEQTGLTDEMNGTVASEVEQSLLKLGEVKDLRYKIFD